MPDRDEDAVERQRDRAGLGTELQHAGKGEQLRDRQPRIDRRNLQREEPARDRQRAEDHPLAGHVWRTPARTPQRTAMAAPARTTETTEDARAGRHAQCPSPVHALPQIT